jgi:hypothetical protein
MRRGQSEQDELYRAYLLRCWQERDGGAYEGRLWRFTVEEIFGERRRHGFASLEALASFLRVELTREGSKPFSRRGKNPVQPEE